MKKNESGIGLVEVMVAAALAGGIALLVMKLSDNMRGVENRSIGVMDSREILTEIRSILENEKNCKLSLQAEGGKPLTFRKSEIDEPGKEEGLPIELWIGNAEGSERSQKKFFDGAELGKTQVRSLRLFMNNGVSGDYPEGARSDLGVLKVSFATQGQGEKVLIRDFLINLDFVTSASGVSTILGCERSGVKSLCDSLNMDYNPQTQKCLNPIDVCDDWQVLAEGNWGGWKSKACDRLDGGYVQSILFSQATNAGTDTNGMKLKCCYSKKYHLSDCPAPIEVAESGWWTGTKEGICDKKPRGFIRKIEFYQGTAEGKDTNGLKVQCCYPN